MYEGRGRGGAAKIRLILLSGQPNTSSFALVLDIIRTIMRIFALCLFDLSKYGLGFCLIIILCSVLRKAGKGQEEHYVFQE